MNTAELVGKIHDTPHKVVLAVTGGGTEVVSKLLRYGGGSNTVLDAVIPYSNAALDSFVGGKPDKYCSADTARLMAMAAFMRARKFDQVNPLIGLGVTCSLARGGPEREGRTHHVFIACQTCETTFTWAADLKNTGRLAQEEVVAQVSLHILAAFCGHPSPDIGETYKSSLKFAAESTSKPYSMGVYDVLNGLATHTSIDINPHNVDKHMVVLSGSFNPIHKNHLRMAEMSYSGALGERLRGVPVDLEISVHNVDKPTVNYHDLNRRIEQISTTTAGLPYIGRLLITNAPTFEKKHDIFGHKGEYDENDDTQGVTFLCGMDTLRRLYDPKYCPDISSVAHNMRHQGAKFIVFDRLGEKYPVFNSTTVDLREMTTYVPPSMFLDDGTASSKIRKDANDPV